MMIEITGVMEKIEIENEQQLVDPVHVDVLTNENEISKKLYHYYLE